MLVLPPYEAVSVCEPTAKPLVLKLATLPATLAVPKVVPPSLKLTVPVGCVPETVADILDAHRAGRATPEEMVERSYARIRAHADPAIFIALREVL